MIGVYEVWCSMVDMKKVNRGGKGTERQRRRGTGI